MIYKFIGIPYDNENEWTRAMCDMDESQEHNVKIRKEVAEEYSQWFHL